MTNIPRYNNIDFRNSVTGKNVPTPVDNQDIANKDYVDNSILALIFAQDKKDAVRVVATSNVSLSSAPNTIDGVSLALGDRIGVVGQTVTSQNGIYIVQTLGTGADGVWVRSSDANSNAEVTQGLTFDVAEGTTNNGTTWLLTTANPITLNTTGLTFIKTNVGTVRKYTTTLSSGQAIYNVSHNLNSNFFTYNLIDSTTGICPEGVQVKRTGVNDIEIDFGENTSVDFDLMIQA